VCVYLSGAVGRGAYGGAADLSTAAKDSRAADTADAVGAGGAGVGVAGVGGRVGVVQRVSSSVTSRRLLCQDRRLSVFLLLY
jgi:hypothetical protein